MTFDTNLGYCLFLGCIFYNMFHVVKGHETFCSLSLVHTYEVRAEASEIGMRRRTFSRSSSFCACLLRLLQLRLHKCGPDF